MIPPRAAAVVFALLTAVVAAFHLALALGAPWGEFAMGGAFRGAWPPAMRVAALVQIGVLAALAAIIATRAGLLRPRWQAASRVPACIVAGLMGVGLILNLITPSPRERLIWAPVAAVLLACALSVAAARDTQA